MNSYCLLLDNKFLEDLDTACTNFYNDDIVINDDVDYIRDFENSIKNNLLNNTSKVVFVKRDDTGKLNIKYTSINNIIDKDNKETDVRFANLNYVNIQNNLLRMYLNYFDKEGNNKKAYILKYGNGVYVLLDDIEDKVFKNIAKIPLGEYNIFRLTTKRVDFNATNSKTNQKINHCQTS